MPHNGSPEHAGSQGSIVEQELTQGTEIRRSVESVIARAAGSVALNSDRPFTFIRTHNQNPLSRAPEFEFIGNHKPTFGPATEEDTVSGHAWRTQAYEANLFRGALELDLYRLNVDPLYEPSEAQLVG